MEDKEILHSLIYTTIIEHFNIEDNYKNDNLLDEICDYCNLETVQKKFLNNREKTVLSELTDNVSRKNKKLLKDYGKKSP